MRMRILNGSKIEKYLKTGRGELNGRVAPVPCEIFKTR